MDSISTSTYYNVFFFLMASLHFYGGECAQISLRPDTFIEAVTDTIHISCCPDGTSARAKEILLMEIAKNGEKPITNIRQNSVISYGKGISNRFQAQGAIFTDVSQSFLNLTLMYPSMEDAGTYTCVMSYLDEAGLLKQDKASGDLVVDKQNSTKTEDRILMLETAVSNLVDRVKNLEAENNDMKKDRKNLTLQLADLTEKVKYTSAFSAAVGEATTITSGKVVVFSEVIMHQGQGYNATTGVFTVPRTGLYAFHLVLEVGNGGSVGEISLMAGNTKLAKLYTQDKDYGDQSSVSSVTFLHSGVEVKAVVSSAAGVDPKVLGERVCVFSGHLIKPM